MVIEAAGIGVVCCEDRCFVEAYANDELQEVLIYQSRCWVNRRFSVWFETYHGNTLLVVAVAKRRYLTIFQARLGLCHGAMLLRFWILSNV